MMDCLRWFDEIILCGIHPDYEAVLVQVSKFPRSNFASQTCNDKRCVWLMATCAVHYNMDIRLIVKYLGGEYLTRWRDVEAIIGTVEGLVSDEDLWHMHQILEYSCPVKFHWEETDAIKEAMLRNGNVRSMP